MSISKLRGKQTVLARQQTVKSPNGCGAVTSVITNGPNSGAGGGGVDSAAAPTTTVATNASSSSNANNGEAHKTVNVCTKIAATTTSATPAATMTGATTTHAVKLLSPAATNAAVVAAATAATITAKQQQQQQQQQHQPQTNLPQTSLLKIEPFIPSLNTRLRRPFGRSYSTLSTMSVKRKAQANTTATTARITATRAANIAALNAPLVGATIDGSLAKSAALTAANARANGTRLRRNPARVITRQRSKSTSSSASNRPTTAQPGQQQQQQHSSPKERTANGGGGGDSGGSSNYGVASSVTTQPNGICRVTRGAHEREKLPDRINYDRRGLTVIPIFEQEPQLRLLSLQHNLINVFHIPKEAPPVEADADTDASNVGYTDAPSGCCKASAGQHSPKQRHITAPGIRGTGGATTVGLRLSLPLASTNSSLLSASNAAACGYRMRNLTPPPVPAPPSSPLPLGAPHHLQLQQRNNGCGGLLPKNLHYGGQLVPLARARTRPLPAAPAPPTPTPVNCRFAVKRSKSFVTNYSRQLQQSLQQNLLRAQLTRAEPHTLGKLFGVAQLKSFDSSSSSALTHTDSTCTFATSTTSTSNASNNTSTHNNHTAADSNNGEDSPQPLEIKNKQLFISYGNIFQHLVFLDLYDNQIERIGNLDGLPALTVLLLGKNRLTDISGLASLRQTLRVLDLHGNKIISISNRIGCLQQLKSLNLAGNQLRQINHNDFSELPHLKELNLKRNKIRRIHGFQHLQALERLWLCHNDLHKVDDMASIAHATNLLEVTIENNPVSLAGDCVSFLVSHLPRLQSLSQMPITEQVRRAAMAWRKHKELSNANYSHLTPDAFNSIKREEVISNARTNWELLRSQQTLQNSLRQHQQHHEQEQQQQHQQRIAKPSELARINESNEAVVAYEELQEFIKLPPIKQQQQQQQQQQEPAQQQTTQSNLTVSDKREAGTTESALQQSNYEVSSNGNKQNDTNNNNNTKSNSSNTNGRRHSGSSGSSLGPNVDSSSSSYSSDVEDSPKLERVRVRKNSKTITQRGRARKDDTRQTNNKMANGGSAAKKRTQQCCTLDASNDGKGAAAVADGDAADGAVANTITAKQTTTTTTTINDNDVVAQVAAAAPVDSNQTDNDSSMPSSRITKANNKTMTMMSAAGAQKAAASGVNPPNIHTASCSDPATGNTPAAQIAGNGSAATSSFGCKGRNTGTVTLVTPQLMTTTPAQVPAQTLATACGQTSAAVPIVCATSNSNANTNTNITSPLLTTATATMTTAATAIMTRTTCKRLMRSQTVVGGGTHNNNNNNNGNGNYLAAPANAANEVSSNATARRTHSSHGNSKAATPTVANSQTQSGFTCIVAPTTLNAPTTAAAVGGRAVNNSRAGATAAAATQSEKEREREREQGGDYLIEICGRYLNVYGQGALRYIDKQWNATKAQDVHTLNFSYINFNNIAATVLGRIKGRFPNAENFVFRETNIDYLGQLNALGELQGISALTIDPEGNAITTKDLWREYAIYRLSHWGLKLLNGAAVSEAEVDTANALYEGLSDLVLWAMPATMLQPLLTRLRLDESCTASKLSPKEWLMRPENKSLRLVVGKEALQWKKPNTVNGTNCNSANQQQMHYAVDPDAATTSAASNAALSMRERGRLHFATMLENTCNAAEKLHKLETVWPTLLLDIVRNALLDYSHLDEYLRDLMNEIMK